MYNNELTLLSYDLGKDEIGNEVKKEVKTTVLCKGKDVGSTEYYNAQVLDLKPEIKFVIHQLDYEEQKELFFKDDKYKILRTYQGKSVVRNSLSLYDDEIELTCEKVR